MSVVTTTVDPLVTKFQDSLTISPDQLIVAKARFLDLEEKDRLNPNNMLIRMLLTNLVEFYPDEVLQAAKDTQSYSRN